MGKKIPEITSQYRYLCHSCLAFNPISDAIKSADGRLFGECRLKEPQIYFDAADMEVSGTWPIVMADDWCLQHTGDDGEDH